MNQIGNLPQIGMKIKKYLKPPFLKWWLTSRVRLIGMNGFKFNPSTPVDGQRPLFRVAVQIPFLEGRIRPPFLTKMVFFMFLDDENAFGIDIKTLKRSWQKILSIQFLNLNFWGDFWGETPLLFTETICWVFRTPRLGRSVVSPERWVRTLDLHQTYFSQMLVVKKWWFSIPWKKIHRIHHLNKTSFKNITDRRPFCRAKDFPQFFFVQIFSLKGAPHEGQVKVKSKGSLVLGAIKKWGENFGFRNTFFHKVGPYPTSCKWQVVTPLAGVKNSLMKPSYFRSFIGDITSFITIGLGPTLKGRKNSLDTWGHFTPNWDVLPVFSKWIITPM